MNLPSPRDSTGASTIVSKKSDRSTVSTYDVDYHKSLGHRNIYVEQQSPSEGLMLRAREIVTRARSSPELDDEAVTKVRELSRKLRHDGEEVIVRQLVPHLIPAIQALPDRRLEMNAGQPWSNAVPVPLDPDVLVTPPPLSKPKPDIVIGHPKHAFSHQQQTTIDLLIDAQSGGSYAAPDRKILFPFFVTEAKAQSKGGTHYVATNQTAGAGAIALNGHLELMQRSRLPVSYDEPQFFSMTVDNQLACLNVHWLKAPAQGRPHIFNVAGLSKHLLDDDDSIRSLIRGIKNILDHGADVGLRSLCEALEAYRAIVMQDREAMISRSTSQQVVPASRPRSRKRRHNRVAPAADGPEPDDETRSGDARSQPRDASCPRPQSGQETQSTSPVAIGAVSLKRGRHASRTNGKGTLRTTRAVGAPLLATNEPDEPERGARRSRRIRSMTQMRCI